MFYINCLIWMLIAIETFGKYSNDCPQNEGYIYCSEQDGVCIIPYGIKEGLMSYGVNGKYNLIPFTNSKADFSPIKIVCDNNNGDISSGNNDKTCCYKSADTGFPNRNWAGYLHENNGGWRHFNDFESQRFGADDQYIYRALSKSVGWCNNEFFSNPSFYAVKHCNYNYNEPVSLRSAEWTLCGNEGVDCDQLTSLYHWIAYGNDESYYYRLVKSNDYTVPCNNQLFDDPMPGKNKYCWKSGGFSISQMNDIVDINIMDNNNNNKYIPPQIITSQRWWWFEEYIKNNSFWICSIIAMLLMMNFIICLLYSKNRKNKYSVSITTDSDAEEETKPINI